MSPGTTCQEYYWPKKPEAKSRISTAGRGRRKTAIAWFFPTACFTISFLLSAIRLLQNRKSQSNKMAPVLHRTGLFLFRFFFNLRRGGFAFFAQKRKREFFVFGLVVHYLEKIGLAGQNHLAHFFLCAEFRNMREPVDAGVQCY